MARTDVTIKHSGTLTVTECPECFILHAIPEQMYARRLRDGGSVYCPNGHSWVFTEPETARLERQLRVAEQARESAQARATHEADQRRAAERSAAAYKGQATRLRTRASAGVCPVPECHRHFENLARHMTSRHPGFKDE